MNIKTSKGLYIWSDDDPDATSDEAYELTSEDEDENDADKDRSGSCMYREDLNDRRHQGKPLLCLLNSGSTAVKRKMKQNE